uniref:Uncharacterized protein n=1 Tax=Kalanchoe fedtschenkoi TaxID=63787 RepID=A0A7N1A8C9_KALFE
MEKRVKIVCGVVAVLGLLSAATGFGAEVKRIKGSQVDISSTPDRCIYPRSPALALGVTAALALGIAHAIINVETGCGCCRRGPRPSGSSWTLALLCFSVSWFTFVIAFLLLLTGAALNDEHGEDSLVFGTYYCYVVKPGVFAGGALLSLASVLLGLVYYITLSMAKNTSTTHVSGAPNQSGIALAQPQYPPSGQDPVFVHEDTYMRRQFT